ncbi:MAG: putative ribokinase [Candidatus Magnetoglobus multicellularis str. Araruama]|uniref:Putative ribokinase n=1 Tax=Candidatus Magnetoglobus multicellularis str. Araruama TaxID=890399 RepID=A0A1V1NYV6_9BACT|nr:MAG: putative ribokinase [Candidatus Magnetoglobus multicellularis str. Araruama]
MNEGIACVGNITKDTLFYVDTLPAVDDVSTVREKRICFGGRGLIVAAILSTLCSPTSLFTSIPGGENNDLKSFLKNYNLNDLSIFIDERSNNYNEVLVTIGKTEENCTSLFIPGDSSSDPSSEQLSQLSNYRLLYFTSHDLKSSIRYLETSLKMSCKKIVNISSYMIKSKSYLELIKKQADVLIGNEIEFDNLQRVLGCESISSIYKYFNRLKKLFMTRGKKGVHCRLKNCHRIEFPALRVDIQTPVGVGDSQYH